MKLLTKEKACKSTLEKLARKSDNTRERINRWILANEERLKTNHSVSSDRRKTEPAKIMNGYSNSKSGENSQGKPNDRLKRKKKKYGNR